MSKTTSTQKIYYNAAELKNHQPGKLLRLSSRRASFYTELKNHSGIKRWIAAHAEATEASFGKFLNMLEQEKEEIQEDIKFAGAGATAAGKKLNATLNDNFKLLYSSILQHGVSNEKANLNIVWEVVASIREALADIVDSEFIITDPYVAASIADLGERAAAQDSTVLGEIERNDEVHHYFGADPESLAEVAQLSKKYLANERISRTVMEAHIKFQQLNHNGALKQEVMTVDPCYQDKFPGKIILRPATLVKSKVMDLGGGKISQRERSNLATEKNILKVTEPDGAVSYYTRGRKNIRTLSKDNATR